MPIYFEAPRHLFDFSPRTLKMYFKSTGCDDIKVDIAVPYACDSKIKEYIIWSTKITGWVLQTLTFGRYIFPFSGGLIAHGTKPKT